MKNNNNRERKDSARTQTNNKHHAKTMEMTKTPSKGLAEKDSSRRSIDLEKRFGNLENRMSRFFDGLMEESPIKTLDQWMHSDPDLGRSTFNPKFEMTEKKGSLVLRAEIPGMSEKDVNVSIEGSVITVSGMKQSENETEDAECHFSEMTYGSFSRSFALPTGCDPEKISARFSKGVLEVIIPKSDAKSGKAKSVKIHEG